MLIPLFWKTVNLACMWIVLKIFLCDSYFVEFAYDPTCNYYERGKYGCRNFHVTKLPLVMLRLLLFLSASLHMLVFACYDNLFAYKMPMHRKYVYLDVFVTCYMIISLCFNSYLSWEHHQNYQCLAKGVKRQCLLGGNPILFLFFYFCSCLVINNSSSLSLDVVVCFN